MCKALNYFGHFFVFVCVVSGCVSISAFASLVGVPVGISSFAVGLKIYAITAEIKNFQYIINKKRKNNDKIVLLRKAQFDTVEVKISKALIDAYISHDDFVSVNNVLR